MTKINLLITPLLFLFQVHAEASTAPDTLLLTLPQALDIALKENPIIQVADKEVALKKVADKETWQNLLPEAQIGSRLEHTLQAAEMKLNGMKFKMGEDGTNTVNAALSVNIPLFAPSVYKAMSISKSDIALAVEKSRATKQDLVNQVTKAYYQLLLAQDSYEVMQKSYAVAEENFRIVSAKYEQGKVSEFDKITAEVQLGSIRPNVVSAHNAVQLSALQLKVLMGLSEEEIKIQDNLSRYEGMVYATQQTKTDDQLTNNSTLRQLTQNREMLEKNIKLQRMNFVPTLSMSFNYQYQSIYNEDINIFGYDWTGSSTLMFNLSIPIFRARNFTKMRSAKLQLEQLDWNRKDVERKLDMQVKSYRNSMEASAAQLTSNRKNMAQAEKAVTIASKRYEVGKGTVLELNSSQVSLTQAQLVYNQSIYDYLVAKADLDKVLGRE